MFNLSNCFKTSVFCVAALISVALPAEEKVRMGVPVFESKDSSLAKSMAGVILTELRQNRNYQLIDLSTTEFDQSNVAQAGKDAGLDYVVLGSIDASYRDETSNAFTDRQGRYHPATYSTVISVMVGIRVFEVETGKVVISANESDGMTRRWGESRRQQEISVNDYLTAAEKPSKQVAFKIMSQIHPLDPAVIQVKGKELTLDMGSNDGITEKQRFAIVREGKPLYNRNGDLIGVDVIEIAHITITRVEPNVTYAKIVKINKDPDTKKEYVINVGDLAKLQDVTKGRTFGEKLGGLTKDILK